MKALSVPLPWCTSQSTTATRSTPCTRCAWRTEQNYIAEHAVAAAPIRLRMMARRSDQGIGILDASRQHGVGGLDAAAGREQGDFIAAGADAGALADGAAACRR